MRSTYILPLLTLATTALAKTDMAGCVSSETVAFGGASLIWYVPGSGEICAYLDCGGGRAPPKTTVPGCPQYAGTASYTPNYLPGYGPDAVASTTAAPASTGEGSAAATTAVSSPSEPEMTGSTETEALEYSSTAVAPSSSSAEGSGGAVSVTATSLQTTITQAPYVSNHTASSGHAASSLVVPTGNHTVTGVTKATGSSTRSSSSASAATGAATALAAVGKEVIGLAVGAIAGLAML